MSTDYFNKYLKYKAKYFKLKNYGEYEPSYQYYYSDIKELCEDTKEEYKDCADKLLNHIKWMVTTIDLIVGFNTNIRVGKIVEPDNPITKEFIDRVRQKEKIVYIDEFYNNSQEFPKDITGVFVPEESFSLIFKEPSKIPLSTIQRTDTIKRGFYPSRGSGKINLHQFALNMKCTGYNYIMLYADGGQELVSMYESYGFRKLFRNIESGKERYELFGLIDEIIEKT